MADDAVVCATDQFQVTPDGLLGLALSALGRLVINSYASATGDGAIDAAIPGNGRTLVEHSAHWVSDYKVAVTCLVFVQRASRSMQVVSPTRIFVRERTTTAVGVDTQNLVTADTPNTDPTYDGEWAHGIDLGSLDLGALGALRPFALTYASENSTLAFRTGTVVLPGQSLDVRYRSAVSTSLGSAFFKGTDGQNQVKATGARILVVALPGVL